MDDVRRGRQGPQDEGVQLKFARRVFFWGGVYGVAVLVPQYVLVPAGLAHPVYFYGFIGVALAWQAAFFVIASDPVRFRPLMVPAVLEKFLFAPAVAILFAQGRTPPDMLAAGGIDLILGLLFLTAFSKTKLSSRGE